MSARDGEIGFGVDVEDAEQDLIINLCKHDMNRDVTGRYKQRYDLLSPYLALPNVLHITGVGCLVYKDGAISETRSGNTIAVRQTRSSIYFYLAQLFGSRLSYEDICVVLKDEINEFFLGISDEFIPVNKMPYIKVMDDSNGFVPYVIYHLASGYDVAISESVVGIKRTSEVMYHAIEISENDPYICMLPYVGYKMGIILTGKGVSQNGKENKELE